MARLQLNKSSLAREQASLRTYERFLPSLDLKRQQLMAERARAVAAVSALEAEVRTFAEAVGRDLPMLANAAIELEGLVRLKNPVLVWENVVGTRLPVLQRVDVEMRPYDPMTKPHWVDNVARLLHLMLEAKVRVDVARERVRLLDVAVTTVTQRMNLFEKVLIPNTNANIKKIRIALSDEEMAAVVRAKLSKRKRAVG